MFYAIPLSKKLAVFCRLLSSSKLIDEITKAIYRISKYFLKQFGFLQQQGIF
jgi:hypothetical protein